MDKWIGLFSPLTAQIHQDGFVRKTNPVKMGYNPWQCEGLRTKSWDDNLIILLVLSREWMGMGVARMIIDSDYG